MAVIAMTQSYDDVAMTLFSWFRVKKRIYGLIARKWLLQRVYEQTGRRISLRTLDRALARMRHLGLLDSETRHRKDPKTGEFTPEISILYFTDGLKSYAAKLKRKVLSFFGLCNLTEYTNHAAPDASRHNVNSVTPPNESPEKRIVPPHLTDWSALGKGVRS